MPRPPSSVLAAELPVMTLPSSLPVPSIAEPVSTRFSTLAMLAREYVIEDWMMSVPPMATLLSVSVTTSFSDSTTYVSLPPPPTMVSLPAPPSRVSLPRPPVRVSSKAEPVRMLFPAVPVMATP